MPKVTRSRTLPCPPEPIWKVVSDAHHLPRWWPRVDRVEAVVGEEFTEVMHTRRGRDVRADYRIAALDEDQMRLVCVQRLEGTPFARVLKSARWEVALREEIDGAPLNKGAPGGNDPGGRAPGGNDPGGRSPGGNDPGGRSPGRSAPSGGLSREDRKTTVTITLAQSPRGFFAHLGSYIIKRAAGATVEEALDGLERIAG